MTLLAKMADWRDEVLLEGDFCIATKKRITYKVTLIPGGLFYSQISSVTSQYEEKSIHVSDIIGCHCGTPASLPSSSSPTRMNHNNTASFTVFAYPFRKKLFSGKKTRHRLVVTFDVCCFPTLEENKQAAHRWRNVISCLARGVHIKPADVERCEPPPWGRFLILVNPNSGPGRALQIFKNEVEPMLEEASIPFKLIVTEYAGHAQDLMHNLDLSEWAAVIIVSGDGLIYEVINGLMQRVDWTSAIKKPIGCVPGGSGNALSCSINYAAGEPVLINPVLHSTFVLIKHRVVPMDLTFVQTPSKQYYSFLSVTWGIVADIDFESEKYRNLGEARFTLGAIKRIVNLRAYAGKLSFLPVAEYTPKTAMAPKVLKKIRRFSLRSMSSSLGSVDSLDSRPSKSSVVLTGVRSLNSTPPSSDKECSGGVSLCANGGDADLTASGQGDTFFKSPPPTQNSVHTGMGAGEEAAVFTVGSSEKDSSGAAVVNVTSATEIIASVSQSASQPHSSDTRQSVSENHVIANGTAITSGISADKNSQSQTDPAVAVAKHPDFEEETLYGNKQDGQAVPTPLLPPWGQPVPDNWEVIQGRFVLACAIYQTHLGSDMLAVPSARLSDGVIHLMFVRDGISRNHLLNLFLTFSEGMHVDSPEVEIVPVLAFRLEPDEDRGNIMIDGERLDPVPVQGQVLPGLARIMAIQ